MLNTGLTGWLQLTSLALGMFVSVQLQAGNRLEENDRYIEDTS